MPLRDPSLVVRLFAEADAPMLTALLHEAYAELGELGLNYTAVDQDEETTRRRAHGGQCWVVERNGDLVATLTMSLPPSDDVQTLTVEAQLSGRAWLNQVAVRPQLRRSGLARSLWDIGREWARGQGAGSIGVDTAVPATHLVNLYAGWGFDHRGTIHWPGKTYDSVVMVHSLGSRADTVAR